MRRLTIPELGLKGIFVKKLVWRAETNQIIGLGEHCFVIDTNSGKVVREFDLTSELLRDVEISSDGKIIAGINDKNADSVYAFRAPSDADFKTIENRGVRLWNARNGKFLRSLDQKYQSQYAIAFSKSGNIVASDATEGAIQLWETSGGRKLRNLKPPKNSSFYLWPYKGGIQFSPTENLLAVVGYPATVYLYDAGTGKIQRTLKSNGQNEIDTLCFSSDGKILFTLRTQRHYHPLAHSLNHVASTCSVIIGLKIKRFFSANFSRKIENF